jgi:hypothetical protein
MEVQKFEAGQCKVTMAHVMNWDADTSGCYSVFNVSIIIVWVTKSYIACTELIRLLRVLPL